MCVVSFLSSLFFFNSWFDRGFVDSGKCASEKWCFSLTLLRGSKVWKYKPTVFRPSSRADYPGGRTFPGLFFCVGGFLRVCSILCCCLVGCFLLFCWIFVVCFVFLVFFLISVLLFHQPSCCSLWQILFSCTLIFYLYHLWEKCSENLEFSHSASLSFWRDSWDTTCWDKILPLVT